MWCQQLGLEKLDPEAEQSPQSQGHCDLPEQNIQVVAHPPYSSDAAPRDFWLFPLIKEKWAGWKFSNIQDLAKVVGSELHALSSSNYQNVFESFRKQLEPCVQSGGEYFEIMWML